GGDAWSNVAVDVATPVPSRPSRRRRPSASIIADEVLPVPRPTSIPSWTSSAARSPSRSSRAVSSRGIVGLQVRGGGLVHQPDQLARLGPDDLRGKRIRPARSLEHALERDRKSTRLNSSHVKISYAVF